MNAGPLGEGQWTAGQVIAPNTNGTTASIGVRIGEVNNAGGLCFFVDEIRVGHY